MEVTKSEFSRMERNGLTFNVPGNRVELTVAKTDMFQEINFAMYLGKILIQQLHVRETLSEALVAI
jgi:hypothetical protein